MYNQKGREDYKKLIGSPKHQYMKHRKTIATKKEFNEKKCLQDHSKNNETQEIFKT